MPEITWLAQKSRKGKKHIAGPAKGLYIIRQGNLPKGERHYAHVSEQRESVHTADALLFVCPIRRFGWTDLMARRYALRECDLTAKHTLHLCTSTMNAGLCKKDGHTHLGYTRPIYPSRMNLNQDQPHSSFSESTSTAAHAHVKEKESSIKLYPRTITYLRYDNM